jgi:DNA-binding transcriptional LysR family regulator
MATAKAAIGAYQHERHGTVSISGFHSAGQALFAPLVRRLAELRRESAMRETPVTDDRVRPGAAGLAGGPGFAGAALGVPRVRLSDEDVAQHDFPALTARYDLVLAHRMDHSPAWPESRVRVIPLAHEPLDIALAVDHPLAAKAELSPVDVVDYAWVASRSGYSPADVLTAIGAVASRPVNVVHRINDYSTAAALVSTGDVIGLLPRYTASPALNPGVTLRPLTGISTRRRIDLLVRPENLKRASVTLVAEALQAVMADMVR